MINWELILALSVYNFVMYVTPGPNNSILTASGIKFGFFRTIPNIFGIPTGHGFQLALVCLGLGSLFTYYPFLLDILRYVGGAYILFLAYKMFGSLNISSSEEKLISSISIFDLLISKIPSLRVNSASIFVCFL